MKPTFTPQRLKGESYKDYQARRKKVNEYIMWYRRGRVFHSAAQGVYRKLKVVQK